MTSFFNRTYQGVGLTGSPVSIVTPLRQPDTLVKYTNIAFQDETSDITSLRIGINTPHTFHLLFYNAAPGIGIPIVFSGMVIPVFYPGVLEALIVGTTTGDVLRLYLSGYEVLPLKER